ncbi:MAG: radical SAM protein [Polyangiaceae bacterium]
MAVDSVDPLRPAERAEALDAKRPNRNLPIAPVAPAGRRRLPLADASRDVDTRYRPIYAVWEITLACDLACRHCGSRAGKGRPDELDTAECLDLVDQMAELGVKEVTLIGGEAYLREDWLDIVRRAKGHGLAVTTTTGGRGLDAEAIARAHEADLDGASVSIDGDAETHDRLRGVKGSYAAAMAAMKEMRARGMRVACNTQINRLSVPHMPTILEALASIGIHSWQIQLTVPMGRAADEPEVLLQPYDLLAIFPMLADLKKRADALGVRLLAGNNVGYFGPYESVLRSHMPRGHGGSCGAGKVTLGIEANGAIKGCPSLSTEAWTAGNVRDEKLRTLWERGLPIRYTRDRTRADLWGFCATCYYADECRAGCTWTADVYFGKPGNNPFCHHRALEMDRAGLRERMVRVEEAKGTPFDHGRFEIVVESNTAAAEAAEGSLR